MGVLFELMIPFMYLFPSTSHRDETKVMFRLFFFLFFLRGDRAAVIFKACLGHKFELKLVRGVEQHPLNSCEVLIYQPPSGYMNTLGTVLYCTYISSSTPSTPAFTPRNIRSPYQQHQSGESTPTPPFIRSNFRKRGDAFHPERGAAINQVFLFFD